jgi:tellurite resistance protein
MIRVPVIPAARPLSHAFCPSGEIFRLPDREQIFETRHTQVGIAPVARSQLLDFLNRNGLISLLTRAEILDSFERRIRLLGGENGPAAAVESVGRLAGRSTARLVVDAGEYIAAADGRWHPRELQVLKVIRKALTTRFRPFAPSASCRGRPNGREPRRSPRS